MLPHDILSIYGSAAFLRQSTFEKVVSRRLRILSESFEIEMIEGSPECQFDENHAIWSDGPYDSKWVHIKTAKRHMARDHF